MRSTWRDHDRDFQQPLPGGETTQGQLDEVIFLTKTECKPLPGFNPNIDNRRYYREQQEIDCDEVYPGIYLGNVATAKNKKYLIKLGITHVLNTAEGRNIGLVDTNEKYYTDTPIKYLGISVTDLPSSDISKYFYTVANFIDEGISTGGKVFVHCMQGVSRSSTCVLAYLMIKKNILAVDAVRMVRANREIRPNDGFLRQLARLDNHLRMQRLQSR